MLSKAHISRIRSLHTKAGRMEAGLFLAEGERLVEDLLVSGMQAHEIFLLEPARKRFEDAFGASAYQNLFTVSSTEMERITSLSSPSPVLGIFYTREIQEFTSEDAANELIIALDDIRDPGNLGTIIRTADWFGIRKILCSAESVEVYNPKVVQATMGSLARVDVQYGDLMTFLAQVQPSTPIYGTLLEGESVYNIAMARNGILLIGNEARGISVSLIPLITQKVFIPPAYSLRSHRPESLNASVATSIVLSEWFRQQNNQ